MRRSPRTRRAVTAVRLALLLVVASTLLTGGPVEAAPEVAATGLGGFTGSAASSAIHVTYDPKGLLPTGAPVDLGAPDALATIASGPSTFARASAADPGDLIANPDALLAQASSAWKAGTLPPYPYRVTASSGVGEPTAESNPGPGLNARVSARDTSSSAEATMPNLATPAVVSAGSMAARATTSTDGSNVTVHSRTTISDVDVAGIVHIDSIVTDLTGTSDGGAPQLKGGTTVTGATLAGTPLTIDDKGVRGNLAGVDLGSLLSTLGVHITLPGRVELPGTSSGELASTGLRIDIEASARTVPGLDDLLGALPPIEPLVPGAPGVEDLIAVARANHVLTVELGRGVVAMSASPEFVFEEPPVVDAPITPLAPSSNDSGIVPSDPGTGLADPVAPVTPANPPALAPAPTTEPISASVGTGIGALALLALLLQPFLGDALGRVAAAQLETDEGGCHWERR